MKIWPVQDAQGAFQRITERVPARRASGRHPPRRGCGRSGAHGSLASVATIRPVDAERAAAGRRGEGSDCAAGARWPPSPGYRRPRPREPRKPMYLLDTNVVSGYAVRARMARWSPWIGRPRESLPLGGHHRRMQAGSEITRESRTPPRRQSSGGSISVTKTYNVLARTPRRSATGRALMHRRSDHLIEDAIITRHRACARPDRHHAQRAGFHGARRQDAETRFCE